MVAAARPPRGGRLLLAGLLAAGLGVAVVLWWPAPVAEGLPQPAAAVKPMPAAVPAAPAPVAPVAQQPDPPAMPQLRVPAGARGQDPLAAALQAAREAPQPPPPPAIATARTLEEAFAAMQAAQGGAPAVPAGTSPFAAR